MEAFKAFCLAFSSLSCSVSFLICSISINLAVIRVSKSGSRRQLSIDKNCRQRGSDENDAPLPLERDASAESGDVVIGREQGNQANDQAGDGLEPAEPIKARPGTQEMGRFWRIRRLLAGEARGLGHVLEGMPSVNTNWEALPIPHSSSATIAAVCLSSPAQAVPPLPEMHPQPIDLAGIGR